MYQPRNRISKGALESIREFLQSRNRAVSLEEVASIYPSVVTWVTEKMGGTKSWTYEAWDWRKEARIWALDHLQYLNQKKERSVVRDGDCWRLGSVG